MTKPQNSNCYIKAWKAYKETWLKSRGKRFVFMACKPSSWSRYQIPPKPIQWIGVMLVWPATAVWLLGHLLIFGTWPHWIWCEDGMKDCKEAVPAEGDKSHKWLPPIFFPIKVQKVKSK